MTAVVAITNDARVRDVRLAARALARHRLVHAYGHVSARLDADHFVVTPSRPLGRITLETPLVACSITGELAVGALPEVRLHQAIYRVRPEVAGVCRFQSAKIIALSAMRRTPRALHGLGAYFAPSAPLWDDPMLVRDDVRAAAVADRLGEACAIVLRGNGAVAVGASVADAACHAFCLEDAAAVELDVLAAGAPAIEYTSEEAARRAGADRSLYDRLWQFLIGDDLAEEVTR